MKLRNERILPKANHVYPVKVYKVALSEEDHAKLAKYVSERRAYVNAYDYRKVSNMIINPTPVVGRRGTDAIRYADILAVLRDIVRLGTADDASEAAKADYQNLQRNGFTLDSEDLINADMFPTTTAYKAKVRNQCTAIVRALGLGNEISGSWIRTANGEVFAVTPRTK